MVVATAAQRRRNVFLTHPTDHQDGNRERPVPDTQQPQRPTRTSRETGHDSTDPYRYGSGRNPGAPPGQPRPLGCQPGALRVTRRIRFA